MNTIKMIPSEKTFVEWAAAEPCYGVELTEEQAKMLLGYIEGHGYGVYLDETGAIILTDTEEPENGIVATGIEELIERVSNWNCEFLQDSEVSGEQREQCIKDMEVLSDLLEMMGTRYGLPLGNPSIKEMIAILSKYPEDYRVTCCGGSNYLYLFAKDKYITIDCERYL